MTMQYRLKTKISTPMLAATQAFYQRVFGMVVAEEWDEPGDRGVILELPDGKREAYLEIYSEDPPDGISGVSLQFRVDSLADFLATLPGDVAREGPKDRPWGSTYLYLSDPNGIPVVVFEGGL